MKKSAGFDLDTITYFVRSIISVLLIENPIPTVMGILCGIIVDGVIDLFITQITNLTHLDFSRMGTIFFIVLMVFIFNLPKLIKHNKEIPTKYTDAVEEIDRLFSSGKISGDKAHSAYCSLIDKLIENVVFPENPKIKSKYVRDIVSKKD